MGKTHVAVWSFMNCATASGIFGQTRKNTDWTNLVKFNDLSWSVRPQVAFLSKLEKHRLDKFSWNSNDLSTRSAVSEKLGKHRLQFSMGTADPQKWYRPNRDISWRLRLAVGAHQRLSMWIWGERNSNLNSNLNSMGVCFVSLVKHWPFSVN